MAIPTATMEFIRRFAMGGGVVIALDQLPSSSTGLADWQKNDFQVKQWVAEIFGEKGQTLPGGGRTHYLPEYKIIEPPFNPGLQKPYAPTPPLTGARAQLIEVMHSHLAPDFALEDNQQSNGLTFIHRHLGADDLYFVTNLQPVASRKAVTFRVAGKIPQEWNPMTGATRPVFLYQPRESAVEVPLDLPPYASTFLMFHPGPSQLHVTATNLDRVLKLTAHQVEGVVGRNGLVSVTVMENGTARRVETMVAGLPKPFEVGGVWAMTLDGYKFPKFETQVSRLASWTEDPRTMHFSGTGQYVLDFQLPPEFVRDDVLLTLDLGSVGDIAEVTVNGRKAGVAWMQPYQLDITGAVRSGANHLEVLVANMLINYVAGLAKPPDVPDDLVSHYGTTTDIYTQGTKEWEHEKKIRPLPLSGLMGPVRIVPQKRVTMLL